MTSLNILIETIDNYWLDALNSCATLYCQAR